MSHDGTYGASERAHYSGGPCPQCGGETITQWIPTRDLDSTETRYLPGPVRCANPRRCVSAG
jgi:hypothetical protein